MTSLWRTCFSALLAATLSGATVSGTVELRDSSDPAVRKKSDFSGVVVWLEPARPVARPPVGGQRAKLVQKDKTFTPHVLAVPVGTTVDFPNLDPIFHNAFSNYDGKVFDVGLYPPGSSRSVRFDRPGFVRVFCNIHASMSAIIAVVDSPWLAVTGGNGKFTIADVPPGDYVFRVFHERAAAGVLDALRRRVAVGGEPVALAPVSISESGYLAIPHKNKYGHEYPPAMEGGAGYPAVRP
jgi:plastocyanin